MLLYLQQGCQTSLCDILHTDITVNNNGIFAKAKKRNSEKLASKFVRLEDEDLANFIKKKCKKHGQTMNYGIKLLKSFLNETGIAGSLENLLN